MLSAKEHPTLADAAAYATPLEQELEERQNWYVRLRWVAAISILTGTWAARNWAGVDYSPWPLYLVGVTVAVYNCGFVFLRIHLDEQRRRQLSRVCIYAQIGLDWLALICLIHYTGGIRSPVSLVFTFHLIIGSLLLGRVASYIQAAISSLLLALLMVVEQQGWWPPVQMPMTALGPYVPNAGQASLWRWFILSAFFGVTSFVMAAIGGRLRERERALVNSQSQLDRALREMEALYELGQVANTSLDVDQVLSLIAENAAGLMGVRACSIDLLDESGESIRPAGVFGLSQEYMDKGPVEVARSQMVAQALAGEAVVIRNAATDRRVQYRERIAQEGLVSILCVPLQIQDRSIGVVRVYSEQEREFSDRDTAFLRNLANLAAVAIESARAYAESEALSEERAWFARTTHHQLRAPLAVVRGILDALPYAGAGLAGKQVDLIERGIRRVDELLDLVRDLLDLANARRSTPDQEAEAVSLHESLAPSVEMVRERAEMKQVGFDTDGLDPEVAVACQADDVRRIFSNLLVNAVKYTPSGGTVTFAAQREGDEVTATVADSGIGIEAEDREKIFRGFYRTEASKATGEIGTGVGLIIVKKLVERWHGALVLDSTPGEGTTFTITLPAADSAGGSPVRR